MGRYDGRPFLKLIDSFVLFQIGHLPLAQLELLRRMEPKLSHVYGTEGAWHQVVQAQMGFGDEVKARIKSEWEIYVYKNKGGAVPVDPINFAVAFVDELMVGRE